jgi:hypothetical protein
LRLLLSAVAVRELGVTAVHYGVLARLGEGAETIDGFAPDDINVLLRDVLAASSSPGAHAPGVPRATAEGQQ